MPLVTGWHFASLVVPMQLSTFYESAIQSCAEKIREVRQMINIISLLRLLLFAGLAWMVYSLTRGFSLPLTILAIVMAALFIGGVNLYFRLKDQLALWEKLLFVNTNELGLLKGQPTSSPMGSTGWIRKRISMSMTWTSSVLLLSSSC